MTEVQPTWLTQEAYDRMLAELEKLITVDRVEIARKIQEAREEGDLKENGGYHAAKEEQGRIESRINRLEVILANSVVGEAPSTHGIVEQGTVVTVALNGSEMRFLLGSAELAEGSDIDVYSPESPIGQAVLGLKLDDEASYLTPHGKSITVKVLKVEHFNG